MGIKQMMNDRVLMRPVKREETTTGGLVIPETVGDHGLRRADVVAVGPGRMNLDGTRVSMVVQPGMRVVLQQNRMVQEVQIDGEDMWIGRESDVVAAEEVD